MLLGLRGGDMYLNVSREILNKYNTYLSRNCTVFSIYCTKALFGTSELYKPDQVEHFWIDFNTTSKSVSLLCQLNQSEGKQEEFYIKITINKLRIENQFDCSVSTIEPAFFSTKVSKQLLSSRVALFTLPENQLERLKTNNDLFDYYNRFTFSESSEAPTPNTITQYLADISFDSPMTPYLLGNYNHSPITECNKSPVMKSAFVKLYKFDVPRWHQTNDSTRKKMVANNATADRTTLVSHINPSIQENATSSDSNTAQDTQIFKKPDLPIKYRSKKLDKSISRPIKQLKKKYLADKSSALEDLNTLPRTAIQSLEKKIPDFSNTTKNNVHQKEPSSVKSEKEQEGSNSEKYPKLTTDKFSSMQVSRKRTIQRFSNTTDYPLKYQRLIEEHSLEISIQKVSNVSRSTEIRPNEGAKVKKSEKPEMQATSTPIQITVSPFQRSSQMIQPTETSQCLEKSKIPSVPKACEEQTQQASILDPNTLQNLEDENVNDVTVTLPRSNNQLPNVNHSKTQSKPKRISKIVKNKKTSDTTLHSLNSNPEPTDNLNDVSSHPDTSRRFFKYKHLRTSIKAKPKTVKKKTNIVDNHPKAKSVNLVKPLNYTTDVSLNKKERISESRPNENSEKIENPLEHKNKVDISNKTNENCQHLIILSDTEEEDSTPKTPKRRRQKKRKTLKKDVVVSECVPYSIWKRNQKEKNKNKSETNEPPQHITLDLFDQVKGSAIQNKSFLLYPNNVASKNRRSCSSSSESIQSYLFSDSPNQMQIAQDPSPVKNREENNGNSIMPSPTSEHQKEKTCEIEPPQNLIDPSDKVKCVGVQSEGILSNQNEAFGSNQGIQSEGILSNQNKAPRSSRRRSSSSDSNNTCFFSESENSENEMQSAQNPRPVRIEPKVRRLSTELVRRVERDDMMSSFITIPTEIMHRATKSSSRETDLTPIQMSLVSDSFDVVGPSPNPDDHHRMLLQNTTINYVSPVYEDLDDENPSDINQPPIVYSPLIQIEISHENHAERPTSSQGSAISINSESETDEQNNTNQVTYSNNQVLTSLRKRTHCVESGQSTLAKMFTSSNCTPLKDFDRMLPQFIQKLTIERDRLLNNIKTKINEDINDNFAQAVDVISKTIEYHETSIKEEQIKLLSILQSLDSHHTLLQKNQLELEKMHCEILQTCDQEAEKKVNKMYKDAEEDLKSYADVVKRDQWHNFSQGIINSVNSRLTGYLDI